MAGFFNILQGGRIRYNAVAQLGQTWSRGQVVVINSAEAMEVLGANNYTSGTQVAGLAMEQCVAAATGNLIQNTATVIAGNTGSMLLDQAVVITDNLSGTGGWTAGTSKVYGQQGGNMSYNSASGVQIGMCLRVPVASGKLTFLYNPPIGN